MNPIPFQDFRRMLEPNRDELERAAARVIRGGSFVLGAETRAFEEEFAAFCGKRFCVGTGNGLDALLVALQAGIRDVRPGDEAIVPAQTFVATWLAATHAGLKPVAVDVDPQTGTLSESAVRLAVTPRTRAVVPVHLFGFAAPAAGIAAFARERGIFVLEDAAQCHGHAEIGSGDALAFSFYPTKNLGALGDGGAVVTDDPELARRVSELRNYGRSAGTSVCTVFGENSRLDEMQAAFLRVRLRTLRQELELRRKIALHYLSEIVNPRILLPGRGSSPEEKARSGVWHLFPVRCEARDELRRFLADRGIQTATHYPELPCEQPCYRDAHGSFGLCGEVPVARRWARTEVSLPLWPGMTFSEIRRVVDACNEFAG